MSSIFSFLTFERPAHPSNANPPSNESNNDALTNSFVVQEEKWSPYQNFVVFISTVLLWLVYFRLSIIILQFLTPITNRQRPVIFVLFAGFVQFFFYITNLAISRWNPWIVIAFILCSTFIIDFVLHLYGITMEKFLAIFPCDGTERISYQQIIEQYVSVRRFIKGQFQKALELRKEQPQQFLISALFFSSLFCLLFSLVNIFMCIYVLVNAIVFCPGLWHNDILKRIYAFAWPHITAAYHFANQKISEMLQPKPESVNPSAPRQVNRQASPVQQPQDPSSNQPQPAYLSNLNTQRPSKANPQRPQGSISPPQSQFVSPPAAYQPQVENIPNYFNQGTQSVRKRAS